MHCSGNECKNGVGRRRTVTAVLHTESAVMITTPVGYGMRAPDAPGLVFCAELVIDGAVTTNPVRPGHASSGYPQGAQGSADRGAPGQRAPGVRAAFDFVLRGYDRNQVDERIAELLDELKSANDRVRALAARLADQQRRTDHAERELRATLSAPPPPAGPDADNGQGFGYRAERLLRMAEAEANEIRGAAIKEAAETMERARAAAEAHRHEIEQNLIMRATSLDQKANEVAGALRDREQAAAAELAAARSEADSVRLAARREMEQARKNVEVIARDMRAQAERWAEQHRATTNAEVSRLIELRDTTHRDLGELSAKLLAAVRAEADGATAESAPGPEPEPRAEPSPRPSPTRPTHNRSAQNHPAQNRPAADRPDPSGPSPTREPTPDASPE